MAERLDQISAAIPLRALARLGHEPLLAEEQYPPRQHAEADVEGKAQLVLAVLLPDRTDAAEKGPQRLEIVLADPREGVERHGRIEILAVSSYAGVNGLLELVKRPRPDAGVAIGRDVGRIHRAERRVHLQPAGIRLAGLGGVAGHAVGGLGEIAAARDQARIGCRLGGRQTGAARAQDHRAENTRQEISQIHVPRPAVGNCAQLANRSLRPDQRYHRTARAATCRHSMVSL
jgi:hypothetical protein